MLRVAARHAWDSRSACSRLPQRTQTAASVHAHGSDPARARMALASHFWRSRSRVCCPGPRASQQDEGNL
eukprot:6189719-Pleurochrysis_carterae.AAC.1